ncbi:hypothetical protein [Actinomadura rayongensis]|uniref:PPE domain-containing protein n=1 Tax=Actinomadura rayongensis TaxID=1429076 RepID=A0A6I4WB98_9ACTN|nr:hypothetical protein [Actinomadura rayongensis]MXQ64324.1 hypothetical protein [Actinomadura rayongensis]
MGHKGFEQPVRHGDLGEGNPAQYGYEQIASFLKSADADSLSGLSKAYAQAAQMIAQAEGSLPKHASRLSAVWEAESQELSAADLRGLTTGASTLVAASRNFGSAMNAAHAALMTGRAGMPPPVSTPVGTLPSTRLDPLQQIAADRAAQEHLARTNESLVSAYNEIPGSLEIPTGASTNEAGFNGDAPTRSGTSPTAGPGGTRTTKPSGSPTPSSDRDAPRNSGGNPNSPETPHRAPSTPEDPSGQSPRNPSDLEGSRPGGPGGGPPGNDTPLTLTPGGSAGGIRPVGGTPGLSPLVGGITPPRSGGLPSAGEPVGGRPTLRPPSVARQFPAEPVPGPGGRPGNGLMPGGGSGGLRSGGVIGGTREKLGPSPVAEEFPGAMRSPGAGEVIGKNAASEPGNARPRPGTIESGTISGGPGGRRGSADDGGSERAIWLEDEDDLWRQDEAVAPPVIGEA